MNYKRKGNIDCVQAEERESWGKRAAESRLFKQLDTQAGREQVSSFLQSQWLLLPVPRFLTTDTILSPLLLTPLQPASCPYLWGRSKGNSDQHVTDLSQNTDTQASLCPPAAGGMLPPSLSLLPRLPRGLPLVPVS